jgi:hypothetical protein
MDLVVGGSVDDVDTYEVFTITKGSIMIIISFDVKGIHYDDSNGSYYVIDDLDIKWKGCPEEDLLEHIENGLECIEEDTNNYYLSINSEFTNELEKKLRKLSKENK